MKHYTFADIAKIMAKDGYGLKFKDEESALKYLKVSTTADGALLAFLKHFDAVCRALSRDFVEEARSELFKEDERPGDIKAFPGIKPGDLIYNWDVDGGLTTFAVVHVTEENFVRTCDISPRNTQCTRYLHWATESEFTSKAEALQHGITWDYNYHSKALDFINRAKAAAEAGDDLTEFDNGRPDDE